MDTDLARAEWALALWCVAPAPVVTSLFTEWQSVFAELPEVRRYGVMETALRVSTHDRLDVLSVATALVDEPIRTLLDARGLQRPHLLR